MRSEDIDLIEQWYIRRNVSSGTKESYSIAIRDYTNLIGKMPVELIEEAEYEEDNGLRPRKRKLYNYLLKYKKKLEDDGKAPGTVNLYFSAIKSFYKAFDITIPNIKMDKGDIALEKNIGKPLTRNDIQQLVSAANHRERALIYLMAMSGMGQQEARDLTINKLLIAASSEIDIRLENVYDLFKYEKQILEHILMLDIKRKKNNYRYQTFLAPEVMRELISYLKERCYGQNEKIRVRNNNDFVFVNNLGNKLSRDSIVTNFRRIGEKVGFKKDNGAYAWWRSHSLRKYFISTIINKIGEKTIADYMAGHKIPNQDRTYWQSNPNDLKEHYKNAFEYLSIDGAKNKDLTSPEFAELDEKLTAKEQEIRELKRQLAEVKAKTEENTEIIERMDKYYEEISIPQKEINSLEKK